MNLLQSIQFQQVNPKVLELSCWDPSLKSLDTWLSKLDEGGPTLFVLEGPTASHRTLVCNLSPKKPLLLLNSWLTKGVRQELLQQLESQLRQELFGLGNFLSSEGILVEYPLLSLIDQGFQYTNLFKALWEIKFLFREQSERAFFLATGLGRWLSGESLRPQDQIALQKVGIEKPLQTCEERLDMIFFLLTLTQQQGFGTSPVIVVDGLERVSRLDPAVQRLRLEELYQLYRLTEQWAQYKSGLGIILGLSRNLTFCEAIQDYHPRLAQLIQNGL